MDDKTIEQPKDERTGAQKTDKADTKDGKTAADKKVDSTASSKTGPITSRAASKDGIQDQRDKKTSLKRQPVDRSRSERDERPIYDTEDKRTTAEKRQDYATGSKGKPIDSSYDITADDQKDGKGGAVSRDSKDGSATGKKREEYPIDSAYDKGHDSREPKHDREKAAFEKRKDNAPTARTIPVHPSPSDTDKKETKDYRDDTASDKKQDGKADGKDRKGSRTPSYRLASEKTRYYSTENGEPEDDTTYGKQTIDGLGEIKDDKTTPERKGKTASERRKDFAKEKDTRGGRQASDKTQQAAAPRLSADCNYCETDDKIPSAGDDIKKEVQKSKIPSVREPRCRRRSRETSILGKSQLSNIQDTEAFDQPKRKSTIGEDETSLGKVSFGHDVSPGREPRLRKGRDSFSTEPKDKSQTSDVVSIEGPSKLATSPISRAEAEDGQTKLPLQHKIRAEESDDVYYDAHDSTPLRISSCSPQSKDVQSSSLDEAPPSYRKSQDLSRKQRCSSEDYSNAIENQSNESKRISKYKLPKDGKYTRPEKGTQVGVPASQKENISQKSYQETANKSVTPYDQKISRSTDKHEKPARLEMIPEYARSVSKEVTSVDSPPRLTKLQCKEFCGQDGRYSEATQAGIPGHRRESPKSKDCRESIDSYKSAEFRSKPGSKQEPSELGPPCAVHGRSPSTKSELSDKYQKHLGPDELPLHSISSSEEIAGPSDKPRSSKGTQVGVPSNRKELPYFKIAREEPYKTDSRPKSTEAHSKLPSENSGKKPSKLAPTSVVHGKSSSIKSASSDKNKKRLSFEDQSGDKKLIPHKTVGPNKGLDSHPCKCTSEMSHDADAKPEPNYQTSINTIYDRKDGKHPNYDLIPSKQRDEYSEAIDDECQCVRSPQNGLLSFSNSRDYDPDDNEVLQKSYNLDGHPVASSSSERTYASDRKQISGKKPINPDENSAETPWSRPPLKRQNAFEEYPRGDSRNSDEEDYRSREPSYKRARKDTVPSNDKDATALRTGAPAFFEGKKIQSSGNIFSRLRKGCNILQRHSSHTYSIVNSRIRKRRTGAPEFNRRNNKFMTLIERTVSNIYENISKRTSIPRQIYFCKKKYQRYLLAQKIIKKSVSMNNLEQITMSRNFHVFPASLNSKNSDNDDNDKNRKEKSKFPTDPNEPSTSTGGNTTSKKQLIKDDTDYRIEHEVNQITYINLKDEDTRSREEKIKERKSSISDALKSKFNSEDDDSDLDNLTDDDSDDSINSVDYETPLAKIAQLFITSKNASTKYSDTFQPTENLAEKIRVDENQIETKSILKARKYSDQKFQKYVPVKTTPYTKIEGAVLFENVDQKAIKITTPNKQKVFRPRASRSTYTDAPTEDQNSKRKSTSFANEPTTINSLVENQSDFEFEIADSTQESENESREKISPRRRSSLRVDEKDIKDLQPVPRARRRSSIFVNFVSKVNFSSKVKLQTIANSHADDNNNISTKDILRKFFAMGKIEQKPKTKKHESAGASTSNSTKSNDDQDKSGKSKEDETNVYFFTTQPTPNLPRDLIMILDDIIISKQSLIKKPRTIFTTKSNDQSIFLPENNLIPVETIYDRSSSKINLTTKKSLTTFLKNNTSLNNNSVSTKMQKASKISHSKLDTVPNKSRDVLPNRKNRSEEYIYKEMRLNGKNVFLLKMAEFNILEKQ